MCDLLYHLMTCFYGDFFICVIENVGFIVQLFLINYLTNQFSVFKC